MKAEALDVSTVHLQETLVSGSKSSSEQTCTVAVSETSDEITSHAEEKQTPVLFSADPAKVLLTRCWEPNNLP